MYPKRIIYCNIQEWYHNFFVAVSVSVLTSWLANIISALLKRIFSTDFINVTFTSKDSSEVLKYFIISTVLIA